MARIFSIEFNYDDAVHHAMISVRETSFHKEYKISLQDEDLAELLLSDKIISAEPGMFVFSNVSTKEYNKLMKEILSAVAHHIHSLQY
jgi:hypothetical protein